MRINTFQWISAGVLLLAAVTACMTPEQVEEERVKKSKSIGGMLLSLYMLGYGYRGYYGDYAGDTDAARILGEKTVLGLVGITPPLQSNANHITQASPHGPYGADVTPTMHCSAGNVCNGLASCSRGGTYSWVNIRHNVQVAHVGARKTIHASWMGGSHVSRDCLEDAIPIVVGTPDRIRVVRHDGAGMAGSNKRSVTLDPNAGSVTISAQGIQRFEGYSVNGSPPRDYHLSYYLNSVATRMGHEVYMTISMSYNINLDYRQSSHTRILDFIYVLPDDYPSD